MNIINLNKLEETKNCTLKSPLLCTTPSPKALYTEKLLPLFSENSDFFPNSIRLTLGEDNTVVFSTGVKINPEYCYVKDGDNITAVQLNRTGRSTYTLINPNYNKTIDIIFSKDLGGGGFWIFDGDVTDIKINGVPELDSLSLASKVPRTYEFLDFSKDNTNLTQVTKGKNVSINLIKWFSKVDNCIKIIKNPTEKNITLS